MEVSTSGAAASTASDGAAGLKPEGDAPSTGQGDAPSAAAATTGSGGVPAAEVDPGILQDMLLFFVHLALHACRGWGAPPPPESTPVCTEPKPIRSARLLIVCLARQDPVARFFFPEMVTNCMSQLWQCWYGIVTL